MGRILLVRLDPNEDLVQLLDELKKKLGLPLTSIARSALWQYCKENLEDGKRKSK